MTTLFWDAVVNMFEHDHSAARGKMATRRLFVFKHKDELGNAPSHKLFELVTVTKMESANPPRRFADYVVTIDKTNVPEGVTLIEKI